MSLFLSLLVLVSTSESILLILLSKFLTSDELYKLRRASLFKIYFNNSLLIWSSSCKLISISDASSFKSLILSYEFNLLLFKSNLLFSLSLYKFSTDEDLLSMVSSNTLN